MIEVLQILNNKNLLSGNIFFGNHTMENCEISINEVYGDIKINMQTPVFNLNKQLILNSNSIHGNIFIEMGKTDNISRHQKIFVGSDRLGGKVFFTEDMDSVALATNHVEFISDDNGYLDHRKRTLNSTKHFKKNDNVNFYGGLSIQGQIEDFPYRILYKQ
jgi:hypothetical protein